MTQDDLEFQISQYLDGTLSPTERAALEQRLAIDADARGMLAEYRRLDEHLLRDLPLPKVKWDRLAEHLSALVDDAPIIAGRISPAIWVRRLAIAACLILMVGITVRRFERHRMSASESDANSTILVDGPSAEEADGAVVQEIAVGPSADFASHGDSYPASQNTVERPGRAFIFSAPGLNGS